MTEKELRTHHGDIIAKIEREAAAAAIAAERARLQAIEEIADSIGDAQLVADAKYGENPMTAGQLALAVMKKRATGGAKHLDDLKADNTDFGALGVGAAPNGGEEGSGTEGTAQESKQAAEHTSDAGQTE